jgi:hypothetical protein
MVDLVGSRSPPGQAIRDVSEFLMFAAGEEPATFTQAEKEASWRHAKKEEISSIEENDTWKLLDLSPGHRPIGLKWVYKLKKNAERGDSEAQGQVHSKRVCSTSMN